MQKDVYKLWINFDMDKIDDELFEKMEKQLKIIAVHRNLEYDRFDEDIYISGTGDPDDYGRVGSVIVGLIDQKWFTQYLTRWLFRDSDGEWEDVIEELKEENLL